MQSITVDCDAALTREALHSLLAEALSFPQWYGNNLDALHDCLTTVSQPTRLVLLHWQTVERCLGRYAGSARRCILAAAQENPDLLVTFQ